MLNWKALSKNALKKELKNFKRKDLKSLRTLKEEIENERYCVRELFVESESESEEEEKLGKIWVKIDEKWEVVIDRLRELELE